MNSTQLSTADIAAYREQGYIKLGQILSPDQVRNFCDELAKMPPRPEDKGTLFFTQKRGGSKLLADFAAKGPQIAAMNTLIGPNLRCWFDQFVVKAPSDSIAESKGIFPWHQDNGYNGPQPDNNITVWIALDETTTENGCIWVVPGSHKQGPIPHKQKSAESWHIEVDVPDNGVAVLLKPGEAVAFTGYTLHRSLGNKTNKPRRAFFLEYCDADACFADGTPINQRLKTDLFGGGLSPVITGTSKFT